MPVSRHTLEKDRTHAAMRTIGDWVDYCRAEERKLGAAHYLHWMVGGADFDYLLKATVGEAYLRALRRGATPDQARAEAALEGNHCVRVWNERTCKTRVSMGGAHELRRWDMLGVATADDVHARYLGLLRAS